MPDAPVRLRPVAEADLELLGRFDTEPAASQPFQWTGFLDPHARWQRWDQDGWIGPDSAQLAVALPDGTLAGIVNWRIIKTRGPVGGCLEIGILLFSEHRGRGVGTAAQRLLVEYLLATTLANRLQAITDVENLAEQRCWSGLGSAARVCCAAWPSSVAACATAHSTPAPGRPCLTTGGAVLVRCRRRRV